MKILIINFGFRGGMAQYPALMTNELAKNENVDITMFSPESEETRSLIDDRVDVVWYTPPSKTTRHTKLQIGMILYKLVSNLWKIKPNVVHFPFYSSYSASASPFVKCAGVPIVATVHDPISHSGMKRKLLNRDLNASLRTVTGNQLDGIIAHGPNCYEQAIEAGYSTEKLYSIPHGLYSHFQQNREYTKSKNSREDEKVVLVFGTIRPNKGYDRLDAIVDAVAEEIEDVTFVVAGSAPNSLDEEYKRSVLSRLEANESIELSLEYIENDEVATFFENADVVLLPYYDATSSGVAMIAYTFDTPIVSTNVGDVGRMIQADQSGLVSLPSSTQKIADNVIDVLSDERLQEQITKNMVKSKEKYRWENIAEEILEVYRDVSQRK